MPKVDSKPTKAKSLGVVVFGGLSATGRAHRDAFVLTVLPKENVQNAPWRVQWKKVGSCRWPRAGHTAVLHPKRGLFFVGGMTRTREGKDMFRTDACMLRIGAWQRHGARMKWMYSDDEIRLPPRRCMASALIGSRLILFGGCESRQQQHQQQLLETAQLLEDRQRLCNDLLVVDLNVLFRLMRLERTEEEQAQAQAQESTDFEDVCLYHSMHVGNGAQTESWVDYPEDSASDDGADGEDALLSTCTHGGAGGVESAGFAQVGSHFVLCGGTTQTNYATLSTLSTLSSLLVH